MKEIRIYETGDSAGSFNLFVTNGDKKSTTTLTKEEAVALAELIANFLEGKTVMLLT